MSRTLRGAFAALLVTSLFAAPLATADAKSKPKCPAAKKAKGKKKHKQHCKKAKHKPKADLSTPVTIDLLDGSAATVDVPAIPLPGGYVLPGMPVTRSIPISGRLHGSIPGGYQLGKDNKIALGDAAITPAPVDVLSDPSCGGSPTLRLNPASTVALGKVAKSAGTVHSDGRVDAKVNALLRLAFDSRAEAGCDKPLVTMGTSETTLPVALSGKVEKATGLTALTLDAPPVPLTIAVCLTPGAPGTPCATPPVGYPVTIAVHTVLRISVGV